MQRQQSQPKKLVNTPPYFNAGQTPNSVTTLNIPNAYQNLNHHQIDQQSQSIHDQTNQNLSNRNQQQSMHQMQTDIPSTSSQQSDQMNIKVEKCVDKMAKKKSDKRFMCCYCSWSGNDNWGLKRHLNTHTKPFVCVLCDYKAARSERLATHVFKVHNKKVCTKCNYLADNQNEYDAHVYEVQ